MDNKITEQLTDWLNTPREKRDIPAGAMLLLRLNNNRFLYANIMRRPEKFAEKLEYELRKHLRIRLDGKTRDDVLRMEAEVMPKARTTLAAGSVVPTDAELPSATIARGRRDDHDSLPEAVQALWNDNLTLYKTIKNVFEQLKTMERAEPCDRYEYLKILDDADRKYRANLEAYDNYVAGSEPVTVPTPALTETDFRRVKAARKTLSKYKKVLRGLGAGADDDRAREARAKIMASVKAIKDLGAVVGEAVSRELHELGIDLNTE